VYPWRATPTDIPDCYLWELRRATADALESYGSLEGLDQRIDTLLAVDPPPISEGVLSQMTGLGERQKAGRKGDAPVSIERVREGDM
jgi:hypothetical protein